MSRTILTKTMLCDTHTHIHTHSNPRRTCQDNQGRQKSVDHTAAHCDTLQHIATLNCIYIVQDTYKGDARPLSTPWHTATHCNALQHSTVYLLCKTPTKAMQDHWMVWLNTRRKETYIRQKSHIFVKRDRHPKTRKNLLRICTTHFNTHTTMQIHIVQDMCKRDPRSQKQRQICQGRQECTTHTMM